MNIVRIIFAIPKFNRYPGYLKYIYSNYWIPRTVISRGVKLKGKVSFSGMPIISLAQNSYIEIGDGSFLCSASHSTAIGVNHPVILRTLCSGSRLLIGSAVRMSGSSICAAKEIIIGNNVVIGSNVLITDTDFHSLSLSARKTNLDLEKADKSHVLIEDDVFIGAGSYILKGVTIGHGAVVGAASVVTKDVLPNTIVCGNPASPIKSTKNES